VTGSGARPGWAAQYAAHADAWNAARTASNFAYAAVEGLEHAAQADLLRCIFGPLPFREVRFDPSWLTWNDGAVVKVADAGCTDSDILRHCGGPGPHVRGCFVVDGLLGKS
jgi:hypothetical protein